MAVIAGSVWLLVLPACGVFSYELALIERGGPIDPQWLADLRVGHSRFREVVSRFGPPDRISFVWDSVERRTTRLEFLHVRERSSDVTLCIPRQEVALYNSGVRFFLLFLRAVRGKSVVPPELDSLLHTDQSENRSIDATRRLSEAKSHRASSGRGVRLGDLRDSIGSDPDVGQDPVRPLAALVLEGSARGRSVLRLEFDEEGILSLIQLGENVPRTDIPGQIRESVLQ
ncbi:MAG: hypothetical protein JXQ29_02450 [Planctomycetes bacterium]|nr:hypothetical protein [Planctomycetota bacterium]